MARPLELQLSIGSNFRLRRVHRKRQLRPGKHTVQLREHRIVDGQVLPMPRDLAGELGEYPLDFLALFDKELSKGVIAIHGLHGLNEKRAAGRRHVVNQTRNRALALGLYRHDKPVGANRHDRLLQKFCVGRRCDDLLKPLADGHALAADFAADGGKLRACRVGDLVFGDDGIENPLLQVFIRRDLGKEDIEVIFHAVAIRVSLRLPRAFENARNAQKLLGTEAPAAHRPVDARAHIAHTGESRRALEGNHAAGRARLLLKKPDFVRVGKRLDFEALLLSRRRAGLIGKEREHLVEL